ncbi:MAG: sugar phosphate isomerase/epimerase family protein [Lachnospiraceae bacterium]
MLPLGVQTKNIIEETDPEAGFSILRQTGFTCADFSLNEYLLNTQLYQAERNSFFDRSIAQLWTFFEPFKKGAVSQGIEINQMHMPYPIFIPGGDEEINRYLMKEMVPKSLQICSYLNCPNVVIHGFKLSRYLGSEEAAWQQTEKFIDSIAPMVKELQLTLCIENIYEGVGGHLTEGPCCDGRKAAERIDRINERYQQEVLGFCFDTGHANLVGIDFLSFLLQLGHRLKVLHIHDNDGISDLHQIPFTFTRTRENQPSTDWNGFLSGLKRIGYQKTLSFETAPVLNAFPEELKKETLTFIAQIGRYFAEQISS